jgi:septum formation protein
MPATESFILASGSPRRRELLASAGLAFEIEPSQADESERAGEAPAAYVRRVAAAKAREVAAIARARGDRRAVLAADTTVVVDGEILGKPVDRADAARMLGLLSDRTHQVITGTCLIAPDGSERQLEVTTEVRFAALTPAILAWYLATEEWRDKAGAYAIQGHAACLVREIRGSYSNVVGLPLCETVELLREIAGGTR